MPNNPNDLVWWKDEDGNLQQFTRLAVEGAGKNWTEVKKGFPVNAAVEDEAATPVVDSETGRSSSASK